TTAILATAILVCAMASLACAVGYADPKIKVVMKVIMCLLCVGIVWCIITGVLWSANIYGLWPFPSLVRTGYWGCAYNALGLATGDCVEYDEGNKKNAPFNTKQECLTNSVAGRTCFQFWGCKKDDKGLPTGGCQQFENAIAGVFKNEADCVEETRLGKICKKTYQCARDPLTGYTLADASCAAYDVSSFPTLALQTPEECETKRQEKCRQSWYCEPDKDNKKRCVQYPFQNFGPELDGFPNEAACKAACPPK
ncbi:MAG: hypothetical protein Harvfovirus8_31, partial [Harvfovirus sp.]